MAQMDRQFTEWIEQNRVAQASLAVMKDGQIVHRFGYGGFQSSSLANIASLSKAITAVCVGRLIEEGRISFTTTLGEVLAPLFAKKAPADETLKTVTLEQLITHRSGLNREVINPAYANLVRLQGQQALGLSLKQQFEWVESDRLQGKPGGEFSYSNSGYVSLGIVIETVTGMDYETYCSNAVLKPLGITNASVDPNLKFRAPNGGWRMSAEDYARFTEAFSSDSPVIGPRARTWIESHEGAVFYGLGTFVRRTSASGRNYWHDGASSTVVQAGAYFLKFDNGWTVSANFRPLPRNAISDLEKRISNVIRGRV